MTFDLILPDTSFITRAFYKTSILVLVYKINVSVLLPLFSIFQFGFVLIRSFESREKVAIK